MRLNNVLVVSKDDKIIKNIELAFQVKRWFQPKLIFMSRIDEIRANLQPSENHLIIADYDLIDNKQENICVYLEGVCEEGKASIILLASNVSGVTLHSCARLARTRVIIAKQFSTQKLVTAVKLALNRRFCYEQKIELDVVDLINANSDNIKSTNPIINVFNSVNEGVWHWVLDGNKIYISDKFFGLLGYRAGRTTKDIGELISLIHPEDKVKFRTAANEYIKKRTNVFSLEARIQTVTGNYKWHLFQGYGEQDAEGNIVALTGVTTDIDFLKAQIEKYQNKALFDALTKLPNRELLYDRLTSAMAVADRTKGKVGLLFIDINKFKDVNDIHGHNVGDLVLIETAKRLNKGVRKIDTVGRFSGDEFLVVLPNILEQGNIEVIIKRIREFYNRPMQFDNIVLNVTCSIGYSVYPRDGSTLEELISVADAMMYEKKKNLNLAR
jgi:diguanylate cyclase (GGDEF)-like protein/PAS domain S-box-containing protein